MTSPTTAILWEIWARNRWALIFAFALLPLAAVMYALANWLQPLQPFGGNAGFLWVTAAIVAFLGVLLSLAALFWSFSFTAMDERGRFAGFPLRLFTLPIRTRQAVAVPLFTGLATIVAVYLAWFFFITRILVGPRLPATETLPTPMEIAWQVLVIASGYVTLQVLIWLLYPTRHLRLVILAVVPIGFWLLWLWVPEFQFNQHPARWFAALGAWLVASIAAAFKVVEWDRRGGWQGALRWGFTRTNRSARAKFSSPALAQFWFEWRRKGWFGAGALGVAMGLSLLLWPVPHFLEGELQFGAAGYPPRPMELMTFWMWPICALGMTAILASGFAKADFWTADMVLPSFHATRPMRSSDFVMAKMRAAAASMAGAWGVFLLFVGWIYFRSWWKPDANVFWLTFDEAHPALWKWLSHPLVLVALAAVQWHAFVGGMRVMLGGNPRDVMVNGWRNVVVLSVVCGVVIWCYTHRQDLELWLIFLPGISIGVTLWKISRTSIFFRRAWPLLSPLQGRALLGIWIGICAAIVLASFFAQSLKAMPPEIIWFFAAWFMPAGEMADCVLRFTSNRHR